MVNKTPSRLYSFTSTANKLESFFFNSEQRLANTPNPIEQLFCSIARTCVRMSRRSMSDSINIGMTSHYGSQSPSVRPSTKSEKKCAILVEKNIHPPTPRGCNKLLLSLSSSLYDDVFLVRKSHATNCVGYL